MLSREEIDAAMEPPAGVVPMPEWGGDVGIRRLSAQELVELRGQPDDADTVESLAKLAARVMCNQSGARLYAADEWPRLMSRGLDLLLRVAKEAQRLNLMSKDAREELRKN